MTISRQIGCYLCLGIACSQVATLPVLASTPNVEWLNQIRSPRKTYELGYDVATDATGSVFITGWTDGVLGKSQFGSSDAFVSKYDMNGNLVWTEQFGSDSSDHGFAVSADGSGNVYISGTTSGDLDGAHPGSGTDGFLTKYDGDGLLLWSKQFGTDRPESIESLTVDSYGNAYVTGLTLGSIDGVTQPVSELDGSAFTRKFDPHGVHLWTKQYGTAHADIGIGISVGESGNLYVSGHTTGSLGDDNAGRFDTFVMKLDADGGELWARQFGTSDNEYNTDVASDGAGNVYVTGYTAGIIGGLNVGHEEAYLTKYDRDGILQWMRYFGTSEDDQSLSVATDTQGNAYVSGATNGDLGATNAGSGDVFVSKFDSSGNQLWTEQFGTKEFDAAEGVAVDRYGNVYLTGHTDDIFMPRSPDLVGDSFSDAFIVKIRNPIPEPSTGLLCSLILPYCVNRRWWKRK